MGQTYITEESRRRRTFVAALCILFIVAASVIAYLVSRGSVDVFSPSGTIGRQERNLIVLSSLLSLVVVVPVFTMTVWIAWRYRETNIRARYSPDWDHNRVAETIWWLVPLSLISVLAVVAWHSSHTLDPSRAVAAQAKPITIQVVALQWRWLFLYPEQHIASLNYVQFPERTPVHFEITADAPMNSFWIPKLGGQIYAMAGMSTDLNLMADAPGDFRGSSANLSGSGFANMNFTARATSRGQYNAWIRTAQHNTVLDTASYNQLAKSSTDMHTATYALADTNLFETVMHKYMGYSGASQ